MNADTELIKLMQNGERIDHIAEEPTAALNQDKIKFVSAVIGEQALEIITPGGVGTTLYIDVNVDQFQIRIIGNGSSEKFKLISRNIDPAL